MIRMQVYIEEQQKQMLEEISSKKNIAMAQLIRDGIDLVLEKNRNEDLQSAMEKSFGIWSDREDIADSVEYLRKLRSEWNSRSERMGFNVADSD